MTSAKSELKKSQEEFKNRDILNNQQYQSWNSDRLLLYKNGLDYTKFKPGDKIGMPPDSFCLQSSKINIPILRASYVMTMDLFIRHQDIDNSQFKMFNDFKMVVSVSHRWKTPEHPDPDGKQLIEVKNYLTNYLGNLSTIGVFYDYSCMNQNSTDKKMSISEENQLVKKLKFMNHLFLMSEVVLVLADGFTDYNNRAWCKFESMLGHVTGSIRGENKIDYKKYNYKNKEIDGKIWIRLFFEESHVTNGGDLNYLQASLYRILFTNDDWTQSERIKRTRLPLIKFLKHHCSFTILNGVINTQNGELGFDQYEIQNIIELIRKNITGLCCFNNDVNYNAFSTSLRKGYISMINRTIIGLSCLNNHLCSITIYNDKPHCIDYTLNPSNMEEETKQLIKEAYGSFTRLVENAENSWLDLEVAMILFRTNSINLELTNRLYET